MTLVDCITNCDSFVFPVKKNTILIALIFKADNIEIICKQIKQIAFHSIIGKFNINEISKDRILEK